MAARTHGTGRAGWMGTHTVAAGNPVVYTTQAGWCHDFARSYWHGHDARGRLVATLADEALSRAPEARWPGSGAPHTLSSPDS